MPHRQPHKLRALRADRLSDERGREEPHRAAVAPQAPRAAAGGVVTVAQVIAELMRLPGHLPVMGVMEVPSVDEMGIVHDVATIESATVTEVRFEGRYVALTCDGEAP